MIIVFSVKIRWVDILTDKETLKCFADSVPINHTELITRLNKLTEEGRSFVMLSNLVKEYDGIYLKEKMATCINNDIIISVTKNSMLDICINKLVSYMTNHGSDFSNLDIDKVTKNVDRIKESSKKRQLTSYKYIEYDKK